MNSVSESGSGVRKRRGETTIWGRWQWRERLCTIPAQVLAGEYVQSRPPKSRQFESASVEERNDGTAPTGKSHSLTVISEKAITRELRHEKIWSRIHLVPLH